MKFAGTAVKRRWKRGERIVDPQKRYAWTPVIHESDALIAGEVEIDVDAIVRDLIVRAARTKSGKATAMNGRIVARFRRLVGECSAPVWSAEDPDHKRPPTCAAPTACPVHSAAASRGAA